MKSVIQIFITVAIIMVVVAIVFRVSAVRKLVTGMA